MTNSERAGTDGVVVINGLRLHYREYGDPKAPPLVLLHGVAMEAHSWDRFAADLGPRYRTLALTARGHGDSERASEYNAMHNIADAAQFIDLVAGGSAVVCGLSMGGATALFLAAMHPTKVSRLVIVEFGPRQREGARRLEGALAEAPDAWDTFQDALPVFHVGYGADVPDDVLLAYMPHVLRRGDDGKLRGKLDPKLVLQRTSADDTADNDAPIWAACAAIKCPTLLVHGEKSYIISGEGMARMATTIPDARLVTVDADHVVPLENPGGFLAAVESFL
ncbi:MAG: alpha/beta hydrolase [Chloroflexi bacterium]|nr:alpha/beta hydrolase [Chloroflexota bacterium]